MKPIILYTTPYCPYCRRAKDLLKMRGLAFEEVDVTEDAEKRAEVEKKTGWMTVPMIFIGDEFIGGSEELYALDQKGELESKVRR